MTHSGVSGHDSFYTHSSWRMDSWIKGKGGLGGGTNCLYDNARHLTYYFPFILKQSEMYRKVASIVLILFSYHPHPTTI